MIHLFQLGEKEAEGKAAQLDDEGDRRSVDTFR